MHTLVFGSISTLCDMHELQRTTCNAAFELFGLGWHWSAAQYRQLESLPSARERLQAYALQADGQRLMPALVERVHQQQCELLHERLRCEHINTRAGVCRIIRQARKAGLRIGLVTNIERTTLEAVDEAFNARFGLEDFDVVIDREQLTQDKPDPQGYHLALAALGAGANGTLAIEQYPYGVQAARTAGIACLATPGDGQRPLSGALASVNCLGDPALPARQLAGTPVLDDGLVTLAKLSAALALAVVDTAGHGMMNCMLHGGSHGSRAHWNSTRTPVRSA